MKIENYVYKETGMMGDHKLRCKKLLIKQFIYIYKRYSTKTLTSVEKVDWISFIVFLSILSNVTQLILFILPHNVCPTPHLHDLHTVKII